MSDQALSTRRVLLGIFFLVGLVLLDQGVRILGDKLVSQGSWTDKTLAPVTLKKSWQTLVLGNCRALVLNPTILENSLKRSVTIAGNVSGTLGSLVFNAIAALENRQSGQLILVLDDWILRSPLEEARNEILQRQVWWDLLSADSQAFLFNGFSLSSWARLGHLSGLWKYQGLGNTLIRSVLGRPPRWDRSENGKPSAHEPVLDLARFAPLMETRFERSEFAISILTSLIQRARQQNVSTALILAPMHRLRNSDLVNDQITRSANDLAKRADVPLFNYLGNATRWAKSDDWWADPGHLNSRGALELALSVGEDLRTVIR